jgi:hypothetical protein
MGCQQSKITPFDNEDEMCTICYEPLKFEKDVQPCMDCKMRYHISCINNWLSEKNCCPVCHKSDRLNDLNINNEMICFRCFPIFSGVVVPKE